MHVLVVEDEPLIRGLVRDLLEEAGFRCAEAADAEEALDLLDGGLCAPDVLATDYNLGPGPDGRDLAREVQRRLPRLPRVFATGNPDCFADHPFAAWERLVAKPFAGADLVAAIHELLSGVPLPHVAAAANGGGIDGRRPAGGEVDGRPPRSVGGSKSGFPSCGHAAALPWLRREGTPLGRRAR